MANIYTLREGGDFLKPEDYIKADGVTPFTLMTRFHGDECGIYGIRFLKQGTPEFVLNEDQFKKKLEQSGSHSAQAINQAIDKRSKTDRIDLTPFYGIRTNNTCLGQLGKMLLGEKDLRLVGEVCPVSERVDFFVPSEVPARLFLRGIGQNEFFYEGNLADALKQFEEYGFSFNLFEAGWNCRRIKGEKREDSNWVNSSKLGEKMGIQKLFESSKNNRRQIPKTEI